MGNSLVHGANDQHAETSAGPAAVATSDLLYVLWTGATDNQVWWTTSAHVGSWTDQVAVTGPGGTPKTDAAPAAAFDGQTVHLAWKGNGDDSLWWATRPVPVISTDGGQANTTGSWGAQKQVLTGSGPAGSATTTAPALVSDGNGVVWMAWNAGGPGIFFSTLGSDAIWSTPRQRAYIASSDRVALVSPANDAADIMLAWKGVGSDPGIYYGTLTGPLPAKSGVRDLLVIAPAAWMSSVNPLITHKNGTGMPTIAASIEAIGSFYEGVDAPEQIKQAIRDAHERLGTAMVMLVGDAGHFPVRFWFNHADGDLHYDDSAETVIPSEPWGNFIQSDLYYANLYHHTGSYPDSIESGAFDTWDANGNGLYNEAWITNAPDPANTTGGLNTALNPDGVDGYPDVAVGRVPARNTADLDSYVEKVIAYETRVTPPELTFTFVADQIYGDFGATTNLAGLLNGRTIKVDYLMIENTGAAISPFVNATAQQLGEQAGTSAWLSYLGHGGPTVWGRHGVFTGSDVAETKSSSGYPVVFACGCGTALFMPNVPWNGFSGDVTSIDTDGKTRGPFQVNPDSAPGQPGLVVTDTSTNQTWGNDTSGAAPLPVPTPKPAPINIGIDCCAHSWLFDSAPGGGIVYLGDHCVSNDSYPSQIEGKLLKAYLAAPAGTNPVLGLLYLQAQREYWGGPDSSDATTAGLGDYHGIPRLYLGWMVYHGDPSLRIPPIPS